MKTRQLTFAALCLALALLLPQLFHMIGMQQAGQIFLPMHIPVLMAGMVLGWQYGALLGLLAPLVSFLLTGMPNAARVVFMMIELMSYGLLSGLLYQQFHIKDYTFGGYISLITAMIGGRIAYGLALTFTTMFLHIDMGGFPAVWAAVVSGVPGLIMQLIFLPALVRVIEKGGYMHETFAVEADQK